jgi:two-component system osmolarity sensor histidine kinase EnvZ
MMKRFIPTGLYWRTFLIFFIPVFLLQVAVTIVFFDRHWSKMTERLAFSVSGEISAVLSYLEISDEKTIQDIYKLTSQNLDMQIRFDADLLSLPNRQGNVENHRIVQSLSDFLDLKIPEKYELSYYPNRKIIFVDILTEYGVVNVVIPEGRLYSASSYIFILWVFGLSILLFSIALLFMRNQIRPIYRLGLIAERLGRGVPVGRFKPTGSHEVRQTGEAFIRMQDRINQYVEQRTIMLAGVSHDLKTPLTRMKW